MATLLITKNPNDYFSFVLNGDYANEIKNIRNDLLTIGNFGHFKTANGANLIKFQNITPSDVTIVDGAITLNPLTTDDLFDALRSVGYFDWIFQATSGGVNRFVDLLDTFGFFGQDGKTVVVDESQSKLIPVTFYNVQKFTQLSDVPSAHIAGKWLMSDGTKLIFVDLPPAPTDTNAMPSGGYTGTGADLNNAVDNLQTQINNLNGLYVGQTDFARLLTPQQDFTIPIGKIAYRTEVNGTPYYLLGTNNTSEFNTFTQVSTTVTFKDPLEIGNLVVIYYQ